MNVLLIDFSNRTFGEGSISDISMSKAPIGIIEIKFNHFEIGLLYTVDILLHETDPQSSPESNVLSDLIAPLEWTAYTNKNY